MFAYQTFFAWSTLALLLVKSTAVVALAFGGAWLLRRRSGAARHAAWAVAMAVLVLATFITPFLRWHVTVPAPQIPINTFVATPTITHTVQPQAKATAPTQRVEVPTIPLRVRIESAIAQMNWVLILLGVWIAGIVVVALRQIVARVQLSRLSRRAHAADPDATRRQQDIAGKLPIARPVALLVSDEVDVPLTWGMFNARVLLPRSYTEWEPRRFDNVLRHELAHVQRGDVFTALLADVACALYWFNPLVWRAATQLRVEREIACDEAVLASGARASDYATDLLELAVNVRFGSLHRAGLAIAGCPKFEQRVRAIVDAAPRSGLTRALSVALATSVVLVLPIAAFQVGSKYKTWPTPSAKVQAFHHMVIAGEFDRMVQAATADPSLINSRGQGGETPLLRALEYPFWMKGPAANAWFNEVVWLVAHGADVNTTNGWETPLMAAVREPEMVKLLLAHGADVNAVASGRTALDDAAWIGGYSPELTTQSADLLIAHGAHMTFFNAVELGRIDDVRAFLNADPGLVNSTKPTFMQLKPLEIAAEFMGRSPDRYRPMVQLLGSYIPQPNIFEATMLGQMGRIESLLQSDASLIRQTDQYRHTALDWAVVTGQVDVANLLLQHGAQPKSGQLAEAVHMADKDMVELLLAHGVARKGEAAGPADIHMYSNMSLLHDWAANNGHPEIAALLK